MATLKVTRDEAVTILDAQIDAGRELVNSGAAVREQGDYNRWTRTLTGWIDVTKEALTHVYEGPAEVESFEDRAVYRPGQVLYSDADWSEYRDWRIGAAEDGISRLEALKSALRFAEEPVVQPEAPGSARETTNVVFQVMIWPASPEQQTQRELYAFNLDEATLRTRFIEPYDQGTPITWDGRSIPGGDIAYMKISTMPAPIDLAAVKRVHREYEIFSAGTEVTNEWVFGPPATAHRESASAEDPSALSKIIHLCKRFDVVARQLLRRHGSRDTLIINDEYDVQDLMRALLFVEFEDVRPESANPSYLGSGSRVDFLIPEAGIVIEVKKTRDRLADKEVGSQLAEDVTRYGDPAANRGARTLVCFVYDPDRHIANPRGLERDLSDASNERLKVFCVVA